MSQAEEDAGMVGDQLATLVYLGYLTDEDALMYIAGDPQAQEKVTKALNATAGVYGHESQDAYDEGLR